MNVEHLFVKKPSKEAISAIKTVEEANIEKTSKMGFSVDKTGKYPVLRLKKDVDRCFLVLTFKSSFKTKNSSLFFFNVGLDTVGLFKSDLRVSESDLETGKDYLTVLDKNGGRPSVLAKITKE